MPLTLLKQQLQLHVLLPFSSEATSYTDSASKKSHPQQAQLRQISKDHKLFRIKSSFFLSTTSLHMNTLWVHSSRQRKEHDIGFLHELTPYLGTCQAVISDHVRKISSSCHQVHFADQQASCKQL